MICSAFQTEYKDFLIEYLVYKVICADDYCGMSLLLAIKLLPVLFFCYRQLIISGVVDTGDKVTAGVMESMKIAGQLTPEIIYRQ
jgi:hypothetical protein